MGTTHCFSSTSPRCGRTAVVGTWRGSRGGGCAAGNSQRWETSGENGPSGLHRPVG
jgi:hypothetical protein